MKEQKNIDQIRYVILLIIVVGRLIFLFIEKSNTNSTDTTETPVITTQNNPAEQSGKQSTETTETISGSQIGNNQETPNNEITKNDQINETEISQQMIINKKNSKQKEDTYNTNKSQENLQNLIKTYAKNHEFSKAQNAINDFIKNYGREQLDPTTYMYLYINSSNINPTEAESITNIRGTITTYENKNLIQQDEKLFYLSLEDIRFHKYDEAKLKRTQIQDPKFKELTQAINKAIIAYNPAIGIPSYYQDALVSLALLKKGYFTIARKLALDVLDKNSNYILPYQVLAYTHFLSNNRKTAIDYFLKLSDFDKENQEMYKFLIGISYYRNQEYTSSILYLNQVQTSKYLSDTYRYLVLNYIEIKDYKKATTSRKKLLGQKDIGEQDYFDYFYKTTYQAYFNQNIDIIQENKQLIYLYINKCYETFTGNQKDICTYGDIGNKWINKQKITTQEIKYLTEKSPTDYLFLIKGEIEKNNLQTNEAQNSYAKGLAISQDPIIKNLLQENLQKLK